MRGGTLTPTTDGGSHTRDDIFITHELESRPKRAPDYERENVALGALAEAMTSAPETILQLLVEAAMALTSSDSAGISLLEPGGENGSFRWVATAGAWAPYRDGSMPREESPCGEVIAREAVLLLKEPHRAFPALLQADPGISEGLLAPFDVDGMPAGTLWAIKHGSEGRFDAEDARLLTSLVRFASVAHQMAGSLGGAEASRLASDARLRALARASSDVFYIMSSDMSELRELAGGDFIADTANPSRAWLRDYIPPEDHEHVGTAIAEAIRTKAVFELEHRVRQADGGIGWALSRAVPILGTGGEIVEWFGAASDITARKLAETTLREGEARQAFLLELSDALRAETSAEAIAYRSLGMLSEQIRIDRCYVGIYRLEEDIGEFPQQVHDDRLPPIPTQVRLSDFPEALRVAFGRTLVVEDALAMKDFSDSDRASFSALGMRAVIAATLRKGENNPLWAIVAGSTDARVWTQSEVSLVEEAAERTWAAIERARAEAALRESEERFRDFAENSADVLWIVNANTMTMEYLSPAFERVWGEARDSVMQDIGRWAELVHPDDREQAAQRMPRLLAGETHTATYRIVRPDGEVRWIQDTGFPIKQNGVKRVGGIAQDVTEVKATEAALRDVEERNRLIVENARDYAILIVDPDDIITEWLPGAEAVFGWTREEAVGRPAGIIFTPEDQAERVPEGEIKTAARDGVAPDVRWHQRKDGSHVFIEGTTSPLYNADGSIRGFLKIGQDVTERRAAQEALEASEQRMRTLVTGIPQMVFRSHGTGERIWGSPQWIEYTGVSFEESVGYGWLDGMHPEDRERTMAAWSGVEERGEYYCEHRIFHAAAGEYRWHQTRATPLHDKDGSIIEWLGTSTDVEELLRLQQRQELLLAELQHRVRNILAMLRSVAGRTAETAETVEDYWQHLEGRISTMARTQGLLTRGIGSGADLQNLVLDELSAQAAQPSRYTVTGPDITLAGKAAEVLGLAIHELATNSVKYGALSAEDGRIDIRWALLEGEERPRLSIIWSEFGVRMDEPPRRQGFGTELITERVPYELQGTGSIDFRETGLVATIEFPLLETPSILQTDADVKGSAG